MAYSNDSYERHESKGKNFKDIPIIINFSNKAISCLDFGGADGKEIEETGLKYGFYCCNKRN